MRKITLSLLLFLLLACNLPAVSQAPVQPASQTDLPPTSPAEVATTVTPVAIVEVPGSSIQFGGAGILYQIIISNGRQPCHV